MPSHVTILGAGLAGLSCSYHLGHENCTIFEGKDHLGGHIYTHQNDGFLWDEGPHVSFTKNDYVADFFAKSVGQKYQEFPVEISNYFKGQWIPHPAQNNLYAVPEPLRTKCLNDFLKIQDEAQTNRDPKNYLEWLEFAFGKTFAENFSSPYTRKYWTVDPSLLDLDWIGERVYSPKKEEVKLGYLSHQGSKGHYMNKVRYPDDGGYFSYANLLKQGANYHLNHSVTSIDLKEQTVTFDNGVVHQFSKLINTIPLPEFIMLANAPTEIVEAAKKLNCTSLLLVNVTGAHESLKPYHWMYVYDPEKLSTRINCIELLSESNSPSGSTGLQVEVYESKISPFQLSHEEIANKVCIELIEMGLLKKCTSIHTNYIPYANVIFDCDRRYYQNLVLDWLSKFGLAREEDDLDPMTNWKSSKNSYFENDGSIFLAGRFGQWKYFWSDDCLLRGQCLAKYIHAQD